MRVYLISIKDADNLIAWYSSALGIDLGNTIVDIPRLSVHFTGGAFAARDVDNVSSQTVYPLSLFGILAIVTEVDCTCATLQA